ncbi:hypothetical protein FNH05_12290 [Amycolatopsis rhizosphaerae]|uniref:Tetratricopeptide repeat protein n=1 Tax=Amycolatopsis rhizosphaerae TaxID=2053003 RepID=A0A558CW84_9PSEU|nr:hypothetical protein [Amycolatopsis rhizosphaerae]TVT52996.1 hypothetical protein FNH05_12290 [Amycolatopsis rhizosphaerae]
MRRTEEELRGLLREAGELPFGDGQNARLEDLLRHAEAGGHERLAFDIRLQMITAYAFGPAKIRMFVPFARCLADFDRNPAQYGPWVERRLLWSFKHVVEAMTDFPEIPLARVTTALDDMERRFQAGGHSPHAVYTYRHHAAEHVGDRAAADAWYEKWVAAPRDGLSDCLACEPSDRAEHLSARGRDEEAIAVAEPVLRGQTGCTEQPQRILTSLLLPYARTGESAAARAAHRRAYRILRTRPSTLGMLAEHVEFCARTGNEARGLELLDRHLGGLDEAPTPFSAMMFAASAALLLRRVGESGHGNLRIRRPAHRERPATEPTADELRDTLAAQALEIAARFDARNGTSHQSGRVRALLAAEPVADHLPLSATAGRTAPVVAEVPPAEVWAGLSAAELLDRAEESLQRQETDTAKEALRRAESRGEETGENDPVLTGRAVVLRAVLAKPDGDPDLVEAEYREAVGHFAAGGDEDRRQAALGRLGLLLCEHGRAAEGLPLLRSGVAHFRAGDGGGTGPRLVWALLRLIAGLSAAGETGEIGRLFGEADAAARRCDDPLVSGSVAWARLDFTSIDDPEKAVPVAAAAVEAYRKAEAPRLVSVACYRLSMLRHAKGDRDGALEAATESVAGLPASAPPALRASVLRWHGNLLTASGRAMEAIPGLVSAVSYARIAGERRLETECCQALAVAYQEAGQHLDCAEVAEEAIDGYEELGEPSAADGCRYLLAQAHQAMGELGAAVARYEEMIARGRERGETGALAQLLAESGDLLDRLDRDASAAERYREAGDAAALSDDPYRVAYCRYQEALSLFWAGRREQALVVLGEADQAVAALPGEEPTAKAWHEAQLHGNAVRILRGTGKPDEAVGRAERAVACFRAAGAAERAAGAQVTLGQVLREAGRASDAEPVLREALAALSDGERIHRGAAATLGAVLAELGREEEAAELRARLAEG